MSSSNKIATKLFQQGFPTGDFLFWQQAWVVPDLISACQGWYELLGVGPFHVLPKQQHLTRHRGRETSFTSQLAVTQAGPVQIELIQQFDDQPSIYRDVYGQGEGGAHHICTLCYAYEDTLKHYEEKGLEVVMTTDTGSGRVSFIDARPVIGLFIEVVEASPVFVSSLKAISDTCAAWDGETDPVRLLKRGGYRTPDGREVDL